MWSSLLASVIVASATLNVANAFPPTKRPHYCPPVSGDFLIKQYQLYPENAEYNPRTCELFMSVLFNASVAIYNTKTTKIKTIEFEGITRDPNHDYSLSGIGFNPVSGLLGVIVHSRAVFVTDGADISHDHFFIQYNLELKQEVSRLNLSEISQHRYSGFQDLEYDALGNTYIVGTFPSSILKTGLDGLTVEEWYRMSEDVAIVKGFGGLSTIGDFVLTNDDKTGQIFRLDLTQPKGIPVLVPHSPNTIIDGGQDGICLPPKYNNTVLLVSQNNKGITVLRSADNWVSAEYLGQIPTPPEIAAERGAVTGAVQVASSVYMIICHFWDPYVTPWGGAGNRTTFPMIDITSDVEAMF
ncbi:hypothetical protein IFR05_010920 [Cadophora sp. M221]|nr:hypothetical protein IFR05_010920 [Cadophora sp. M221]